MMYGKIIDGQLQLAPNPLTHGGYNIHNPRAEQYEAEGYMAIVDMPRPEPAEGEEVYYTPAPPVEQNGQIIRGWVEAEPPIVEPGPVAPTQEEQITNLQLAVCELYEIVTGDGGNGDN